MIRQAVVQRFICGLFIAIQALSCYSICNGQTKRRELRMAGPIVSYKGGSGGGEYTLLIRGRFRTFSYSEPIPWLGLRRIEDIYLGSVIAARQRQLRGGYKVTAIEIVGLVNKDVRALWDTITHHFEALAGRNYQGAYAAYSPKLRRSISFAMFETRYSAATFDLQPIIIVQPNPLSRYGIISYGINIRKYSKSKASMRVELRHFLPAIKESWDYNLTRTGKVWRITSITVPN